MEIRLLIVTALAIAAFGFIAAEAEVARGF
jgi:hypothetical protein